MKAKALKNIWKGGVNYPPGSSIDLTDPQEVSRLVALKAIEPISEENEPEKPKAKKK